MFWIAKLGDIFLEIIRSISLQYLQNPFQPIRKTRSHYKEIIMIFNENQIKGIVVGNPINMDGSASQSSQ